MFEQLLTNCCVSTFAYLVIFGLYALFNRPTNKIQLCDFFLATFLVVMTGIRYNVGADWQQYYRTYSNLIANPDYIDTLVSWYGLDAGIWYLMSYIAKTPFGTDPHAIFWVVSMLTYPPMVLYFRKRTDSAPWALLTYFFLGFFGSSINILRHTLAAVCSIWAFEARTDDNYIGFAIGSVLALLFHSSAVFAICVSLVSYSRRPTYKLLFGCIALGFAGLAFFRGLFQVFSSLLPFLSRFQSIIDNMSGALDRQYMWIVSLIYFALACILVVTYLHQTLDDKVRDTRMDAIVCAICFGLIPNVVSFAIWPADRMAFFVFLMMTALIPWLQERNPKLQTPLILAMCLWHIPYALFSWDNVNAFLTYIL